MFDTALKKIVEIAEKDESVFYLSTSTRNISDYYAKKLPNQYLNTSIAEQNTIGVATGLALEGRKVILEGHVNFMTLRCIEQIKNDAVRHEVNLNIVARGAGFYFGEQGSTHHGLEDMAMMKSLPIILLSPCSYHEANELLPQAITQPGVSYIRLDHSISSEYENTANPVVLGEPRWIMQGEDAVILCCSGITQEALLAAKSLKQEGLNIGVVSIHTVNPIDKNTIRNIISLTDNVITLEEHTLPGGLGSTIAEICMDESLYTGKFTRLGVKPSNNVTVGSQAYLRKHHELDSCSLKVLLMKLLQRKRLYIA